MDIGSLSVAEVSNWLEKKGFSEEIGQIFEGMQGSNYNMSSRGGCYNICGRNKVWQWDVSMLDDIHTPQSNTLKSNSMIHYTENEVNGAALKELTGSFEDFKELVPKAGDRLILKKCLREEFAVTHTPAGSLEISASSVTSESQSVHDTDQLSQGQSREDSSTMCKC